MIKPSIASVALAALCLLPAGAQESTPTPALPGPQTELKEADHLDWILGGQANFIGQHVTPFHSAYSDFRSLQPRTDTEISELYTLFLGVRVTKGLDVFVDPELATGHGIGGGNGAAGYYNGDVIRNPTLGGHPYFGRYFLRWTIATGSEMETEDPLASANQMGGQRPADRLVFTVGKFGTNDIFDTNRYANSSRTQFLNWSFISNLAWDFAADTRGYTQGVGIEWKHPDWAVRAGLAQMPTTANGPELASFPRAIGENLEVEFHPRLLGADKDSAIVRVLAYHNVASMANYSSVVAQAAAQNSVPVIGSGDMPGRTKTGFGLNFEQPLADNGDTGLFARYGWSDGRSESFAFSECDSTMSLGAQISGAQWDRPKDRVGFAMAQNLIFAPHRAYLAAGGQGFIIGDGHLNYQPERIMEAYYWWQLTNAASLTFDLQYVQNPGYNVDRGPVVIPGLRFHIEY